MKPVAYRVKLYDKWQYFDNPEFFPHDGCEPLYLHPPKDKEKICYCSNPVLCDMHDKCMKDEL
jgi:hypothetical protein